MITVRRVFHTLTGTVPAFPGQEAVSLKIAVGANLRGDLMDAPRIIDLRRIKAVAAGLPAILLIATQIQRQR